MVIHNLNISSLERWFVGWALAKLCLFVVVVGFLFGLVGVVFANPLPMDSLWEGKPIQYLSVVFAEFCGLLAGVSVLSYKVESKWRRAAFNVLVAIVVSYAIGVAVWSWAHAAGLLLYNPINPFLNYSPYPLGWVVLLLPEFVGTAIGTVLIRVSEKAGWKTSFFTMAAAMVTSFLVGMLLANVYLRAI